MRAGELRHRVQIMRPAPSVPNAYNESELGYESADAAWANVEDLYGSELLKAQQVSSEATVRVTMRYREDITTRHRIEHRQRMLELVGPPIDMEGRRRELQLLCREAG